MYKLFLKLSLFFKKELCFKNEGRSLSLKLFFAMNDIVALNWIKLSKIKPEKKKLTGDKPYTTKDIQDMLQRIGPNLKFRCIVHVLSASGMRIGGFSELKLKHIQDMPNGCRSILVYDDDKAEYTTFIHQEAVEALEKYLESRRNSGEVLTPESWLIPSKHDVRIVNDTNSIRTQMCRYAHKGSVEIKKRGRYEKQANPGILSQLTKKQAEFSGSTLRAESRSRQPP